jgi:hypothetical protein
MTVAKKKAVKKKQKPIVAVEASKAVKGGFDPASNDAYLPAIPVGFEIRAGLPNYEREMQERLQDVEEETRKVFYVVPVKLSKEVYKKLLVAALEKGRKNVLPGQWTEQNHLEMLVEEHT